MAEALLVAAGGGGDVIAAAMLAPALGLRPEDAVIATLGWERLLIDPVPGPRSPAEFSGLSALAHQTVEVLPTTVPKARGTSTLPRLREALGHRLVLLDPRRGAAGLAEQLGDVVSFLDGAQALYLVDVGGDVLASGHEPGLRSPLADALMLAAVARLNTSSHLLVAGPGLDGELSANDVLRRLRRLGAIDDLTLTESHARPILDTLAWHPSEATALLAAAALGLRGLAEIRDAGTQCVLNEQARHTWSIPASTALRGALAEWLYDTASFTDAEEILRSRIGWTELDYERAKAAKGAARGDSPPGEVTSRLLPRVLAFEREAAQRGTHFATFRRIAEAIGAPHTYTPLRTALIRGRPDRHAPPLWCVA